MKKPSDDQPWDVLYEKVIGLGEKSLRKSHFPELQRKIRELEREVAERQRREKELQRSYENRAVSNELLKLSLQEISVEELCQLVVEKLFALSWLKTVNGVTIFLFDEESRLLLSKAHVGNSFCPKASCEQVPFGQCLCGQAIATGKVAYSASIDERHTLGSEQAAPHGHYCVPIMFAEKPLGVISFYLEDGHQHDQREEDFFVSIANTLAGIIQRHIIVEERNRYEVMLGRAQKIEAIGTLSGGIAHDFNNLLAPILGYAELALRDLDKDSRNAHYVREIVKAASRAKDLVKQILALSYKVEHRPEDLKPTELEPVVREVLGLVRASIPTTVEIIQRFDEDGCPVLVNPTHIHQVLLNLCTNAYHAMREGGGVINIVLKKLELYEDDPKIKQLQLAAGHYMRLSVTDSGTGMNPETVARIFDPYFTTKKQGEGTGLGLAVVNGIVKSYGGYITVYSEPGVGSSFNVHLPCCDVVLRQATQRGTDELPTGTEHVLVVDDEAQVGQMACAILEQLGYRTSLFQQPAAALAAFKENPAGYDLVMTDMTMPKMTGVDLLKGLRSLRRDVPVILCTGFSELIDERRAYKQGFQSYLMKPVVLSDLAKAVRNAIDASRQT